MRRVRSTSAAGEKLPGGGLSLRRLVAALLGREGTGSQWLALFVLLGGTLVLEGTAALVDAAIGPAAPVAVGSVVLAGSFLALLRMQRQGNREIELLIRIVPPVQAYADEVSVDQGVVELRRGETVGRWRPGNEPDDAFVAMTNLQMLEHTLVSLAPRERGAPLHLHLLLPRGVPQDLSGWATMENVIAAAEQLMTQPSYRLAASDLDRAFALSECALRDAASRHGVTVTTSGALPRTPSPSYDETFAALRVVFDETRHGARSSRSIVVDATAGTGEQTTALTHAAVLFNFRLGQVVAPRTEHATFRLSPFDF